MKFEDWYQTTVGISAAEAKARGLSDVELLRQCFNDSLRLGTKRLLVALDAMDSGCREPGFRGFQNGLGEDSGTELQEAREELAAMVGHGAQLNHPGGLSSRVAEGKWKEENHGKVINDAYSVPQGDARRNNRVRA